MPKLKTYRIADIPINGMTQRQVEAQAQAQKERRAQRTSTGPAWYTARMRIPVWVVLILYGGILATWALTFLALVVVELI